MATRAIVPRANGEGSVGTESKKFDKGYFNEVTAGAFKGKADEATHAGTADTAESCSGNSATATKATQDSDGKQINTTYAKLIATGSLVQFGHLDNASSHNAMYRGKDLTSYFNSGEMSKAIAAGTFADIFPGDYITKSVTVNGTTYSNVKWIVGDLDYHLGKGDTETTAHHVLMFPEGIIGTSNMNATNITTGGYTGSRFYKETLPLYVTGIVNAFGDAHVLSHKELLSNATSDTIDSMAGANWKGCSTDWAWQLVRANLMSEVMTYGTTAFSSSYVEVGDCNSQIAAMRHYRKNIPAKRDWYWLRSVAGSSGFCLVGGDGLAGANGAYSSGGVRPYFLLR